MRLVDALTAMAGAAALMLFASAAHAGANAGACGFSLSAPVQTEWAALGGASGPLGCPTADETPGSTSPLGDKADEADFTGGMILHHVTGPRAGQTYAVTGCVWRLYFQYGGPSGWLGLPTSEPVNFPDGQRQSFEGGRITYERADDSCSAEPAAQTAAPAALAATSALDAYSDGAGGHVSVSTQTVATRVAASGYTRTGPQAKVFDAPGPGLTRLRLFRNDAGHDFVSTATDEGEREALADGCEFEATQGYVWKDPRPGATQLEQFRDPNSGRHWLAAGEAEADAARAAGFVFVRIEGYAPAP